MMNCEQFELSGLDVGRPDSAPEEAEAAREHLAHCFRCQALLASWHEAKEDLRLLRASTHLESAPARVEMRLKQELRTRREARVPQRTFAIASWALAAAAVLAVIAGRTLWHGRQVPAPRVSVAAQAVPQAPRSDGDVLVADYDSGEFTQLPVSMPTASSAESILQARVQRGALMQFGLPVAPEQVSDWVDVDFLVGEDGQPLAVRLHQDSQNEAVAQ